MNKKIITGLIILMGVSILGIIVVQLVWMNNALRVKNELFNRSVNEALTNTVNKLENIHDFSVVNRMIFSDSMQWINEFDENIDIEHFPHSSDKLHFDSLKKPRQPVRIIREFKPGEKKSRIEIKVDANSKSSGSFSYNVDANVETNGNIVVFGEKDDEGDDVFIIRTDTIISDIDSLFETGFIRIDSVLTNLDTFSVFRPDISKRARLKAGHLKRMANQVVTEISDWDIRRVDEEQLQKVLKEELINKSIPIDFEYGILKDRIFVNGVEEKDSALLVQSKYLVNLYPNDIFQKNLKLALYFPERDSFIYRSLNWLLVASFLFSLFILVTFGLSIFYLLRQKKISEMKSDFINNMTHEFKTPIATISVATDSIVNEKVVSNPERIRYFAGMIKKENNRMNRQVEDILTIARLDKKDFEFTWEAINIHDLIEDAVQGIILQVEKRSGKVVNEMLAENPVAVTDKMHFTNVIFNLLDNAIKYSSENPEIKISSTNRNNGILVSIQDNGIGMTKAVQSKIFERFYRQTSGNIHNVKGFGLGLSYVKAVLESNHGTINVQSELGKGSRFDVFLPFIRK